MLRTSSQVIQLAGSRAIAPGQVCLLVPRHLRCFSNRYLLGLIDDRQDHPVRWLLTTQGHLDEGPSEEGNPIHSPLFFFSFFSFLLSSCVSWHKATSTQKELLFLIHMKTGRGANSRDHVFPSSLSPKTYSAPSTQQAFITHLLDKHILIFKAHFHR